MTTRQPLPDLWLLSDARNDAALDRALARLPRGSGFIYRHYHLAEGDRRRRFDELLAIAGGCGHLTILGGPTDKAVEWQAQGCYGPPERLARRPGMLMLAGAHDAGELVRADAAGADAVLLSPVFPTRSHPGAECLGVAGFRELAARSTAPVIALGGMNAARARELDWPRWAAIDGLS